jgi:hypothetical protein
VLFKLLCAGAGEARRLRLEAFKATVSSDHNYGLQMYPSDIVVFSIGDRDPCERFKSGWNYKNNHQWETLTF